MDDLRERIMGMYKTIDGLLRNREFSKCDEVLQNVDVSGLNEVQLVGYLRITFPARNELPYWRTLLDEVKTELKESDEYDNSIFVGLEY